MSEISTGEQQEHKPHIKAPWQQQLEFWHTLNTRNKEGLNEKGEYIDGKVVVRSFLHQESNAGIPGKEVGGAAVAMNEVIKIMQNQLGIINASASLNPDSLSSPTISEEARENRTILPFATDFVSRPDITTPSGDKNVDLTEVLTDPDLSKSYIEYAAMLMNGSDVVFPNYWTSGILAVRAKEYLQTLLDNKQSLVTIETIEENGEVKQVEKEHKIWKIPKIVYCNHSLPARIDQELTSADNPDKELDPRRVKFQEEVYRKADAIMVWTNAERDDSIKKYDDIPDIGDRMHVVKAPVQFDKEKAKAIRSEVRQQFFNGAIDDNTLVYYYQGRFEDYKHPEILLQSFIDLYLEEKQKDPESQPNIACLLVGGPFTDKVGNPTKVYQDLLDRIERIPSAYKAEIKARISMPGSQPKEAGHAAGDVLVFPSIKESLGLTLVEAVMSGNVIIASDSVETVKEANGNNGFYATSQENYKKHMADLLHDPEKRNILHEKLQKNAAKYTPEQTAADIQKMFQAVGIEVKKPDHKTAS